MKYFISLIIFLLCIFICSCTNDVQEIDAMLEGFSENKEIAKTVEILYSDSAVVRVRIIAPTLVHYMKASSSIEEFPDGLRVEFLNENKQAYTWLTADYAIRDVVSKQIITQKNVELRNRKNERILTSELIWNEMDEILFTEKYVKIIQPATQDTTEGFGFVTNQEFTKFEIKRRGIASLNAARLKEELEIKP
jgi:LPS export ABC transporter protein LptC